MPSLNVTTAEQSSGGGIPTGTGVLYTAGATDAGPPPSGPGYAKCQSLNDFVNAFGPRSSTSAVLYDSLDEFFHDGGQLAYVTRVTDSTATTATLTLNDGLPSPKPTVTVNALTPGAEGNNTNVTVTVGTNTAFTASTTSSSTSITSVSSFANIGVGTAVSGAGIPSGTYIATINKSAGTATLSQAATATATGVSITPGTFTITVQVNDSSGNQITLETHGPYYLTSQLFADTTSGWVTFIQATGSGNTTNLPVALVSTPLAGGADANDLSASSYVSALSVFPSSLGPGTVTLPGQTTTTAWTGLLSHAQQNNRFAVLDMADNTSAASVQAAAGQLAAGASAGYGMLIQGSLVLPGLVPGTTRTVPGSAAVAALCAQVATTTNQAQAPCGMKWGLDYPIGFTTFYGPVPSGTSTAGCFKLSDVNTLESANVPVNVFANFYGTLCLFGFVSPLSSATELVYDQATAIRERMALVADCQAAMAPFLFDDINTATITALQTALDAVGLRHYTGGALYDGGSGQANQAFEAETAFPVNSPQTAQAKQLNAQVQCRIVRYADTVNTAITVFPVTVALPTVTTTTS